MSNCQAGDRLQALRRRLAWRGVHLGAVLHTTALSEQIGELNEQLRGVGVRGRA